jgi:hypothetical protein
VIKHAGPMNYEENMEKAENKIIKAFKNVNNLIERTVNGEEVTFVNLNLDEIGDKTIYKGIKIAFNPKEDRIYGIKDDKFFHLDEAYLDAKNPETFADDLSETDPVRNEIKDHYQLKKINEIIKREAKKGFYDAYDPKTTNGKIVLYNPKIDEIKVVSRNGNNITPISTKKQLLTLLHISGPETDVFKDKETLVLLNEKTAEVNLAGVPLKPEEQKYLLKFHK